MCSNAQAHGLGFRVYGPDGHNLTTLAPDIVAAILDDALPSHITLFDLAVDHYSALWSEQRMLQGQNR